MRMGLLEIVLRLCAATVFGAAIGLNRDLHGKATGVRTLGLVALGAAAIVVAAADLAPVGTTDPNVISRVVQGILTGVGFIGAGVILHSNNEHQVRGLTTAACVWLTACVGVICGVGHWPVLLATVGLAFLVLLIGHPFERYCEGRWGRDPKGPNH